MLNNVSLMGRLVSSPELRMTPNGTNVCSFTIACDKDYKKEGEQPNWIDCVAWKNTAEFISKYFNKGSLIAINGQLQTRSYQDRNGNNRKVTEVVIFSAYFCEKKAEQGTQSPAQSNPQPNPQPSAAKPDINIQPDAEQESLEGFTSSDEDLPF